MPPKLSVLLEFARAEKADDPFAFRLAPQTYLLRKEGGGFESATLAWGEELLRDLASLSREGVDPSAVQRVGDELRAFLEPTGWEREEAAIIEAVKAGHRVTLTLRSAAAELYALPWELLTLRASGQHIGELSGVLLRYEWPGTEAALEEPSPRLNSGRVLLAWSAAGGVVPAREHIDALRRSSAGRQKMFDPKRDVLAHVSYGKLADALLAATEAEPIAVVHLLCHGAAEGQTFGLAFSSDSASEERVVVDAGRLRQLFAPHAGRVRLVVLSACDSGNSGAAGNHLGSVAQALHRAGIEAVVASRFPLSAEGSIRLVFAFYASLMRELSSVEGAFLAARGALARDPARQDWASLMLYAHGDDEAEARPLVFRPYRGLLAFESRHAAFFLGRDDERAALKRRVEDALKGDKPRFQVVAGASGSGKSSLVLAGLIPDLMANGAGWDVVKLRPASLGGALTELWKKLHALPEKTAADAEDDPAPSLITPRDIEEESRRVRSVRPGRPLLLVVDQFEELFTAPLTSRERDTTVQALWLLSRSPELSTVVLITLRVEFLGRCGEIVVDEASGRKRLDRIVFDPEHTSYLVQLDAKYLRAVIEEPARRVGLRIEENLTDTILDDVGDDTSALPLLEYALDELWQRREKERLTQEAYRHMGGFKGALIQTADRLLDSMSVEEQRQARRLLVRLVDPAESVGADTRCRAWITQVRPRDTAEAEHFNCALDKLVKGRLLVIGDDDPLDPAVGDWAELAHEALIRAWVRLRDWIVEDREMLHKLAILKRATHEWISRGAGPQAEEYLLGRSRLAMAKEVLAKYSREIEPDVREFIEASQRAKERTEAEVARRARTQKRLSRALTASAVILSAVMALLVFVALRLWSSAGAGVHREDDSRAKLEAERKRARALAVRAEDAARLSIARASATTDPTLSAAALREVEGAAKTPAFLRIGHMIAEEPLALTFFRAHEGAVLSIEWSRDGRRLLTASEDGTVEVRFADGSGAPVVLRHDGPVLSARFSPDERRILSSSLDKTARIWDAAGVGPPLVLPHEGAVYAAAFSPEGERVVTASADGMARVFRADGTGEPISLKHDAAVYAAAFSPEGERVVTASADGMARVFRADGAGEPVSLKHDAAVYAAVFSPDGARVATGSLDATAKVFRADGAGQPTSWRLDGAVSSVAFSPEGTRVLSRPMSGRSARLLSADAEGKPVLLSHEGDVLFAGYSADGRQILTTSADGTARVTRADGRGEPVVLGHSSAVFSAAWSADGRRVATGSADGGVRVFAVDRAGRRITYKHDGPVRVASFSPDGSRIVTASDDGTARVFRADGAGLPLLWKHRGGVTFAAWSPDGGSVVTAANDGIARVFRADGSGLPVRLEPDARAPSRGPLLTAAWSPDSRRLVVAARGGGAFIFQADGRGKPTFLPHAGSVIKARWSPDGGRILTLLEDGAARVHRTDGAGEPMELKLSSRALDASWSPDRERIAVAVGQGIELFRAADGASLGARRASTGAVFAVEWSADSRLLLGVSALEDRARRGAHRVSLWDAEDSAALVVMRDLGGSIAQASWSPDGERVVTAASDGKARVFRSKDGAFLFALRGGTAGLTSAIYSPDGKAIVTASEDGTAQVFRVDEAELMSFLWSATSSCLPATERVRLFEIDSAAAQQGYEACIERALKVGSHASP